jgi:hypothetical protein
MTPSFIVWALLFVLVSWWMYANLVSPVVEGLVTRPSGKKGAKAASAANSSSGSAAPNSGGEGTQAENYASTLKSSVVALQDELLVDKYKTDYDNIVVDMDDYLNLLMLKQTLNMRVGSTDAGDPSVDEFDKLVTLSRARDALNEVSGFLDK